MTDQIKLSDLFKFHPKQLKAFELAKENRCVLYGGTRGPGKSYWLRWMLLYSLIYQTTQLKIRRPVVGLFAETYPALQERQISKIHTEFPEWLGRVRETKIDGLGFYLNDDYGAGVLRLRNMDDPRKYLGGEYSTLGLDQVEQIPEEVAVQMISSLRFPGVPSVWLKFLCTANPGGVGHNWVKRLWIDDIQENEWSVFQGATAFIRAQPKDNPSLDAGYWAWLDNLKEPFRSAWYEGNWDAFAGQAFPEIGERHLIDPFDVPDDWPILAGVDWGFVKPFAYVRVVTDPDSGRVYVTDELYEVGLTDRRQARLIQTITPARMRVRTTYADPAMWTRRNKEDVTFTTADEYRAEGVYLVRGDNNRIVGKRKIHELLAHMADGRPGLMFFRTVKETYRTLTTLVSSKKRPEDVDTLGEDHLFDALKYALSPIRPKPQARRDPRSVVRHPVTYPLMSKDL